MIRPATSEDVAGILKIYAPFVTDTAVSFELECPDDDEMTRRIQAASLWLVDDSSHDIRGYAYATPHRPRGAYRFTVEVSAYVAAEHHSRGVATALYRRLLTSLAEDFHTALAIITLPNHASVEFHRSLGFTEAGVLSEVGYKFGEWHDVLWMQRPVAD